MTDRGRKKTIILETLYSIRQSADDRWSVEKRYRAPLDGLNYNMCTICINIHCSRFFQRYAHQICMDEQVEST